MFFQKLWSPSWQNLQRNHILQSKLHQIWSNNNFFPKIRSFKRSTRNQKPKEERNKIERAKESNLAPTPFEGIHVETGGVPQYNIGKATIFALAFSAGSFLTVSIWEYENLRARLRDRKSLTNFNWFKVKLNQKKFPSDWRLEVDTWWNKLTPGERVFAPICALNIIVFGLWRIPKLQTTMVKYFCSNPAAKIICWPMCLSTFSHYSMFHIFANMYVLHSFSNVAVATLGREQFLGLYLSAGVISSLGSYIYKAITSQAGLSLGASGAIMAILGYVCCEYPDTRLSILFLPMFTFSAGAAIKVIMGMDLAGVILGWKFFDHAAHLGGALYGLFWCFIGKNIIWPEREHFLKHYHQLRSSSIK